jgi:DNA-binding response OmpR family regulator
MFELPATRDAILILPFTWRELLDRVRREANPATSGGRSMGAKFGDIHVDFLRMQVSRSQNPVVLTPQEFKLLRFFVDNPHRVLSRDELLNEVWGYNNYPSTRTVDNHVWMLRRKLEGKPACPVHFLTVQRIGYKFVPHEAE